jgi:hypothetical protein
MTPQSARTRLYRERCMAGGLCIDCGKPKAAKQLTHVRCRPCAIKHSERNSATAKAKRQAA